MTTSTSSCLSSRARLAALTLTVVAVAACGAKKDDRAGGRPAATAAAKAAGAAPSAGPGGACDRREREHLCSEYHGPLAKPAWVQGECDAMQAPTLPACPADGAVGRCTRGAGTAQHTVTVFYGPLTVETSKVMCGQGGQWSAG